MKQSSPAWHQSLYSSSSNSQSDLRTISDQQVLYFHQTASSRPTQTAATPSQTSSQRTLRLSQATSLFKVSDLMRSTSSSTTSAAAAAAAAATAAAATATTSTLGLSQSHLLQPPPSAPSGQLSQSLLLKSQPSQTEINQPHNSNRLAPPLPSTTTTTIKQIDEPSKLPTQQNRKQSTCNEIPVEKCNESQKNISTRPTGKWSNPNGILTHPDEIMRQLVKQNLMIFNRKNLNSTSTSAAPVKPSNIPLSLAQSTATTNTSMSLAYQSMINSSISQPTSLDTHETLPSSSSSVVTSSTSSTLQYLQQLLLRPKSSSSGLNNATNSLSAHPHSNQFPFRSRNSITFEPSQFASSPMIPQQIGVSTSVENFDGINNAMLVGTQNQKANNNSINYNNKGNQKKQPVNQRPQSASIKGPIPMKVQPQMVSVHDRLKYTMVAGVACRETKPVKTPNQNNSNTSSVFSRRRQSEDLLFRHSWENQLSSAVVATTQKSNQIGINKSNRTQNFIGSTDQQKQDIIQTTSLQIPLEIREKSSSYTPQIVSESARVSPRIDEEQEQEDEDEIIGDNPLNGIAITQEKQIQRQIEKKSDKLQKQFLSKVIRQQKPQSQHRIKVSEQQNNTPIVVVQPSIPALKRPLSSQGKRNNTGLNSSISTESFFAKHTRQSTMVQPKKTEQNVTQVGTTTKTVVAPIIQSNQATTSTTIEASPKLMESYFLVESISNSEQIWISPWKDESFSDGISNNDSQDFIRYTTISEVNTAYAASKRFL